MGTDNAVKFVDRDSGLIGGWAIPFGGPISGKDLDGEYFDKDTDLALDWFPDGRPLLYHHGIDNAIKTSVIGRQVSVRLDAEQGVWAESQLDKAHRYHDAVMALLEEEALGYSSGTMKHLIRVAPDGKIVRWPWVELTLTPIPANPYGIIEPGKAVSRLEFLGLDVPEGMKSGETKVWEETENEIRHQVRDPGDFQADSFRRITIKKDEPRVFAVIGRLEGETTTIVQSLRFPKEDGWTMAGAKKWAADHPDVAKASKGLTFEAEADIAVESLADVTAFIARTRSLADLRAKEGRTLSGANRERLANLMSAMRDSLADIEKLLDETGPDKASAVLQEYVRYQKIVAELAAA